MFKKFILLGFCFTVLSAFLIPEKIEKKADKVILKHFNISEYNKQLISISEATNSETDAEFNTKNFFRIFSNEQFLGYGYIGNAPSKTATFDYLVLFDQDLIIIKSKVLIYREEYGGEIGSKRWLKQFNGATTSTEELRYNQEIIPISGATISVQSMTKAMNELLRSLKVLREQNVL